MNASDDKCWTKRSKTSRHCHVNLRYHNLTTLHTQLWFLISIFIYYLCSGPCSLSLWALALALSLSVLFPSRDLSALSPLLKRPYSTLSCELCLSLSYLIEVSCHCLTLWKWTNGRKRQEGICYLFALFALSVSAATQSLVVLFCEKRSLI